MNSLENRGEILTQTMINEHLDENRAVSNFKNAQKIFSRMPSPTNDIESNVGLVVGKIQSGKTSNIISLTAHALDNGYRLVILLLADTNVLLNQNSQRIFDAFRGIDNIRVLNESDKDDFVARGEKDFRYFYKIGTRIVLCALKHYGHINEIYEKFLNTPYANDYALIIDDESDDVSQNTSRGKYCEYYEDNSLFFKEGKRSSTNASIHNLKESLTKSAYISVTASPQANILLQTFQDLSPNYCVVIEPGENYYDLSNFHDPSSNKIIEVEDFDKERFDSSDAYIPNSLYNAFCFFIAGILVRKKREIKPFKSSFLIHPSSTIITHQSLFNILVQKIDSICDGLAAENELGQQFLIDVQNEYKNFRDPNEICIHDVYEILYDELKIHCFNSDGTENDIVKATDGIPFHIVVGGNMLDRGLTLPGLSVTYMTRESEKGQADTLLQRARWLGYKENYFDLCRVYLTPLLKTQFEDMIEHYDSVWEFLCYCSDLQTDMKNEKVELVLNSDVLRVSSPNKVSVSYDKISSNYVQKYITGVVSDNAENIALFKQYEGRNGEYVVYNDVQTHKKIKLKLTDLKHILQNFHISDLEIQHEYSTRSLLSLFEKINLPDDTDVDMLQMRIYDNEERSTAVDDPQRVSNLLQGRSEGKVPEDEGYYPGDRYIVANNIMLQVHHVILKNDIENKYKAGDEVIMLAVLFPHKYKNMGVVTRKELS